MIGKTPSLFKDYTFDRKEKQSKHSSTVLGAWANFIQKQSISKFAYCDEVCELDSSTSVRHDPVSSVYTAKGASG